MRKYLLFFTFVSIILGQDTKSDSFFNKSTFSNPKLYCSECKLSMRETITRYVCRDNHMSVLKSDVKINEDGTLHINEDGTLHINEDGTLYIAKGDNKPPSNLSKDDYLKLAGEDLQKYVFETVIGITSIIVGTIISVEAINNNEPMIMGQAIQLVGVYYYIKALFKINSAGKNLKQASGKND